MKLKRLAMLRLVRWHRRMGFMVAFFLVVLATTGILINHSGDFDLDQPVNNSLVLNWYGIEQAGEIFGGQTAQGWFSQVGDGLYWQENQIARCQRDTFVGVVAVSKQIILACEQVLIVLDNQGQVEEKLDSTIGLPTPVTGLMISDTGDVLIAVADQATKGMTEVYQLDLESAQWNALAPNESLRWPELKRLPLELNQRISQRYSGADLSWERVLLDLHSGRLFGSIGNWFMDIVAILILVLAASGIRLWWARPARK